MIMSATFTRQVNPTTYRDDFIDNVIDCTASAVLASGIFAITWEPVSPVIVYIAGSAASYFVRRGAFVRGDANGRSWNRQRYEQRIARLEMELSKRPVRVVNTATRTEQRNVITFPPNIARRLPELCRVALDNGGRVSHRPCCEIDGIGRSAVTEFQNILLEHGLALKNPRTKTTALTDDGKAWAEGFASPAPEDED